MYHCKFLILSVMLFAAVALENPALTQIGIRDLPQGAFEMRTLLRFTGYSLIASMSVLSCMVLISSRLENRRRSCRLLERDGLGTVSHSNPHGTLVHCDV